MKKTAFIILALAAPLAFAQSGSSSTGAQTNGAGAQGGASTTAQPDQNRQSGTGTTGALGDTLGGVGGAAGFSAMDKNHDGSLSRDEIGGNARLSSRFGELDSDKNGTLSDSEFSKFEDDGKSTKDKVQDKTKNLNSPKDANEKLKDNNQPSDFKK